MNADRGKYKFTTNPPKKLEDHGKRSMQWLFIDLA
jgi:hypothetical protein